MPVSSTQETATLPARPRGFARLAFQLPIQLYHLGLGWVLGHRFLLLTHRGRVSGRIRQTVLEVVRYDPARREYTVVAGFGAQADWYRNLLAHPAIEVQSGRDRFHPTQRFLTPTEGSGVLAWYEQYHPRALRGLVRIMRYPYDGSTESRLALATALPMVAFRRQD
jgi:deazaflavin-dependent oxidoreductase (nitroreductase family)